ncbi:unnamed protein product [Urochloa humidicola]
MAFPLFSGHPTGVEEDGEAGNRPSDVYTTLGNSRSRVVWSAPMSMRSHGFFCASVMVVLRRAARLVVPLFSDLGLVVEEWVLGFLHGSWMGDAEQHFLMQEIWHR